MKILHLPIEKCWFDMILFGEKKEDYRKIKPHWNSRLQSGTKFKKFDIVLFENGYSKNVPWMKVDLLNIRCGVGRVEWGAPEHETVYILRLGNILEVSYPGGFEWAKK